MTWVCYRIDYHILGEERELKKKKNSMDSKDVITKQKTKLDKFLEDIPWYSNVQKIMPIRQPTNLFFISKTTFHLIPLYQKQLIKFCEQL